MRKKYIAYIHFQHSELFPERLYPDGAGKHQPLLAFLFSDTPQNCPKYFIGPDRLCCNRRQLNYLCPQFPEPSGQPGTVLPRSGGQDLFSPQRKTLYPVKFFRQCTDFSHKNDRRRLHLKCFRILPKPGKCADKPSLSCRSSFFQHCCRCILIHSRLDQSPTYLFHGSDPHQKNKRSVQFCKSVIRNLYFFPLFCMPCDHMKGRRKIPMRDRNACIRRNCKSRSHSWDDFKRNPFCRQTLCLLGPSPEYKRISSF